MTPARRVPAPSRACRRPRRLAGGLPGGAVVGRADVLQAHHALAVDDERLGHTGGAERELGAAGRIGADPAVRIAMALQERADCAGRVADRDPIDLDSPAVEFCQDRRFADAGHTPAREQVEQARLARRKVGRFQTGGSRNGGRQVELRHFPVYQLRTDRRIVRLNQPPGKRAQDPYDQDDRQKAKRAAHWAIHLRHARRACPARASRPPSPMSPPPNQMSVTSGFHHKRSCQRPSASDRPMTV